ncbi:hypothetical protein ACPOL_0669 [Acidisarcina polymorpha]|uniref:Uncharacterized protein n=1 Tax=Acidisarcina polymorpha TaxID=2211140 RepID=A0A2Z5FU79_9BACT|nr:hypothetical protein ACPOL_0669 [Acidisarcina polymorpha]
MSSVYSKLKKSAAKLTGPNASPQAPVADGGLPHLTAKSTLQSANQAHAVVSMESGTL